MAQRIKATYGTVPSSHVPIVSRPEESAAFIAEEASKTDEHGATAGFGSRA
jgi:hypothetical protein